MRFVLHLTHILSVFTIAVLPLAGCKSSVTEETAAKYGLDEAYALLTDLDRATPISAAELPNSAQLNGFVFTSFLNNDDAMLGDVNVTANFAGGTMTGKATNVRYYAANSSEPRATFQGSLDIDGVIVQTSFFVNIDGSLSAQVQENSTSYLVDVEVDADSLGTFGKLDGGLVAVGDVDGSMLYSEDGATQSLVIDTDASGLILKE